MWTENALPPAPPRALSAALQAPQTQTRKFAGESKMLMCPLGSTIFIWEHLGKGWNLA